MGVLLHGLAEEFQSLFYRALQTATGGILVATATEEAGRHLVTGEIVHTAQGELHEAGVLGVLADKGRKAHALNLQGHVDNALRVAVLDAEHTALLIGERHYGGIHAGDGFQLHIEQITDQTHAVGCGGPEDIPVDAVLVYATCQEQGDTLVDDASRGGIGEGTGIGHHARVEAGGLRQRHCIHAPHLPKQVAEHLAGGAHLGARNPEITEGGIGVEVVVGHHHEKVALCATLHTFGEDTLHAQGTGGIVHVAHPQEVCLAKDGIRLVGMPVVTDNFGCTGHPLEKVRKTVGDNHGTFLAQSLHPRHHAEGTAQGISVGIYMAHTGHPLGLIYPVLQSRQLPFCENLFHNKRQKYKE